MTLTIIDDYKEHQKHAITTVSRNPERNIVNIREDNRHVEPDLGTAGGREEREG